MRPVVAGFAVVRRRDRKVAELHAGDIAGELGPLLDRRRTATVRAVTPLERLVVNQTDLRACVDQSPEPGWLVLQSVASRLSE